MKTIMFSPRNTGFIFNRFHTFTEHLLNNFKLFTQLKDLSHHFKPANLIYFDQNSYSKMSFSNSINQNTLTLFQP